ncbi:MAG: MarR family transcriptional regulator [Candidatus Spyradocola sp.]
MTDVPRTPPSPLSLPVEPAQRISRALRQLERQRRRFLDERLAHLGLCGDMPLFLLTLSQYPGLSQEAVGVHLCLDKGNLARMAMKLEHSALIERRRREDDRRQYALHLTDKGREAADEARAALRLWQREVLDGLTPGQEELLLGLLGGMLDKSAALLSR